MSMTKKQNSWSFDALTNKIANPTWFLKWTGRILPFCIAITVILFALGLYLGFSAPQDYQQGNTVRIMFIHVPAVMVTMVVYMVMVSSALGTLIWRQPLADVSAKSAAPIGAVLALIGLITGSIWGKPMWGAWWVWDARLTSFLILFLVFIGLIVLRFALEEESYAPQLIAILILVGALILPIVHYSVEWWNTLHQPNGTTMSSGGVFRLPLIVMIFAFNFLFLSLHLANMRNAIFDRRINRMQRKLAQSI